MKKILIYVFSAVIVLSGGLSVFAFISTPEHLDVNLTIVRAPDQTETEWPVGIPNPLDNIIALPDTPNLALNRPVAVSSVTETFIGRNAVDGELLSYWESNGFPGVLTVELDGVRNIQTVALGLNPSALWEPRSQTFEVQISQDGNNFTTITPEERHDFHPDTGNTVRIDFNPTAARYVRFVFTANSAARTNGAQVAEVMIFEG